MSQDTQLQNDNRKVAKITTKTPRRLGTYIQKCNLYQENAGKTIFNLTSNFDFVNQYYISTPFIYQIESHLTNGRASPSTEKIIISIAKFVTKEVYFNSETLQNSCIKSSK